MIIWNAPDFGNGGKHIKLVSFCILKSETVLSSCLKGPISQNEPSLHMIPLYGFPIKMVKFSSVQEIWQNEIKEEDFPRGLSWNFVKDFPCTLGGK